MKQFWKDWKRMTKREKEGVKSLKIAKKLILENVPKEEIIAIYVKGSFVRREMNKKSDVDTMTVVKSTKTIKKLKQLAEKHRHSFDPQIQFSVYSLWELKHNKKSKSIKKLRANPSRMTAHIDHYKLIYGRPLKKTELRPGETIHHLKGMIHLFNDILLPMYKKKEIGFSEVSKQVFWLVENEQKVLGKNPPHNWRKLAKSVKDEDHIIHETLRYRIKKPKDKLLRANYIKKLKRYLDRLEKLLK